MLITIFLLIVLAALGAAALPLMLGLIPPNPYYGWPARRSSSKPTLWRRVNVVAGAAVFSAALLAVLAIVLFSGTWLRSGFAQLALVVVALGAALGVTFLYCRKVGG
jgi:hypothetical protein